MIGLGVRRLSARIRVCAVVAAPASTFGCAVLVAALVVNPRSAWAYCPSYGTGAGCAVEPVLGDNPSDQTYRTFFDKVGTNTFSASEGPALLTMTSGCKKPTPAQKLRARFPCHVLWAIAQQESAWTHFCVPEAPGSAVGKPERTIVSFDCGYGIGQVTSGMREGESPDYDQKRVASDPLYNMAVGAGILQSKWEYVQCVGDRNPDIVEHWYSALWAYNGLAYTNNPNNPTHSAGRNVYNPRNGGSYPYQEKVLGWMEFPKAGRWPSILPAYPARGEIGTGSSPRTLSEPKCATPTSCTRTRTVNKSPCTPPPAPVADAGPPPPPPPAPPPPPPLEEEPDAGGEIVPASAAVEGEPESGCACAVVGVATASGSRSPAREGPDSPLRQPALVALGLVSMLGAARRRTGRRTR